MICASGQTQLASCFAVAVAGFSVMNNHLHDSWSISPGVVRDKRILIRGPDGRISVVLV
jgi:hypothetical protein